MGRKEKGKKGVDNLFRRDMFILCQQTRKKSILGAYQLTGTRPSIIFDNVVRRERPLSMIAPCNVIMISFPSFFLVCRDIGFWVKL